jgi:hypothetical protein
VAILAAWLQLIGTAVTAAGLLYAWNRATARFTRWRAALAQRIAQVHALVIDGVTPPNVARVNADFTSTGSLSATVEVVGGGTVDSVEDRLARLEQRHQVAVAALPDQIDRAIDDRLGDLDAEANTLARRDIYLALLGLAIGAVGQVLGVIAAAP